MSESRLRVPQMLGLEALTRVIVAYIIAGADEKEVDYETVSQLSGVASDNIRRNASFYEFIGLLEGGRGKYRLTELGKLYAQALNWGRIKDAATFLRKGIRDNDLVSRTLGYIDLNEPVTKDDLISRIAMIANVTNATRYRTGINGFIDMLISVELLKEDEKGNIVSSKPSPTEVEMELGPVKFEDEFEKKPTKFEVPISITLNIDVKDLDAETLKQLLKTIKEALTEQI